MNPFLLWENDRSLHNAAETLAGRSSDVTETSDELGAKACPHLPYHTQGGLTSQDSVTAEVTPCLGSVEVKRGESLRFWYVECAGLRLMMDTRQGYLHRHNQASVVHWCRGVEGTLAGQTLDVIGRSADRCP